MNFKRIYFFPILLIIYLLSPASSNAACLHPPKSAKTKKAAINWISMEEAAARTKKEPRKIFIDVYTDWCGWCHKMEKKTFTDPAAVEYVNSKFYAVRFDAESETPVTIEGKTYKFNEAARSHELAIALLQGQLSFPTTVYLDENLKMISPVPGYLDAPMFRNVITYFGENHYKKLSFEKYTAQQKKVAVKK